MRVSAIEGIRIWNAFRPSGWRDETPGGIDNEQCRADNHPTERRRTGHQKAKTGAQVGVEHQKAGADKGHDRNDRDQDAA